MPKFGWDKFGEGQFGTNSRHHHLKFRMISGIPLGFEVRRTYGKRPGDISAAVTFRVRRGNGAYSSVLGKKYQDKYKYSAAMAAIDNGTPATKAKLAAAVYNWQTALSAEQKKAYNTRATKGLRMSGYNLFIKEFLLTG